MSELYWAKEVGREPPTPRSVWRFGFNEGSMLNIRSAPGRWFCLCPSSWVIHSLHPFSDTGCAPAGGSWARSWVRAQQRTELPYQVKGHDPTPRCVPVMWRSPEGGTPRADSSPSSVNSRGLTTPLHNPSQWPESSSGPRPQACLSPAPERPPSPPHACSSHAVSMKGPHPPGHSSPKCPGYSR